MTIAFFFIFIVFSLGITYVAARRTRNAAHFYTAGGQVTGLQNGLALAGDYMSAASFLGIAGLSYKQQDRSAAFAQRMALPPLPPAPAKGVESSIDSLQMHIAASIAMSQNAAIYTIDVAGFNSVSRSTDLVEQLTSAGYKAYFEDRQFAQGRMHLVRVGPYLVQADADADAAKIRQLPGYSDARVSVVLPPPKQ